MTLTQDVAALQAEVAALREQLVNQEMLPPELSTYEFSGKTLSYIRTHATAFLKKHSLRGLYEWPVLRTALIQFVTIECRTNLPSALKAQSPPHADLERWLLKTARPADEAADAVFPPCASLILMILLDNACFDNSADVSHFHQICVLPEDNGLDPTVLGLNRFWRINAYYNSKLQTFKNLAGRKLEELQFFGGTTLWSHFEHEFKRLIHLVDGKVDRQERVTDVWSKLQNIPRRDLDLWRNAFQDKYSDDAAPSLDLLLRFLDDRVPRPSAPHTSRNNTPSDKSAVSSFMTSEPRRQSHYDKRQTQRPARSTSGDTLCLACGSPSHLRSECKHKDATCSFCNSRGHIEKACRQKKKTQDSDLAHHRSHNASSSRNKPRVANFHSQSSM